MPKLTHEEYATFIKFMMRTTSENDAEALVALRKANAVLNRQGVTWEQLCKRLVTVINELPKSEGQSRPIYEPSADEFGPDTMGARPNVERDHFKTATRPRTRDIGHEEDAIAEVKRIDQAFADCERTVIRTSKFWNTIQDFKEQWTEKHFLSERQKEVLFKAAQPRR